MYRMAHPIGVGDCRQVHQEPAPGGNHPAVDHNLIYRYPGQVLQEEDIGITPRRNGPQVLGYAKALGRINGYRLDGPDGVQALFDGPADHMV
ncbi:hypothetical protein MOLA_18400 [Moorella thermoacetica]|nr:hypothetical protein MOLA_18400 [Moorella thermoacetica]